MNRQTTLIRGVDIGDVPPTPMGEFEESPFFAKTRKVFISQAKTYGFPISFSQEQKGSLIQNIYPKKKMEEMQISSSSKVELGLHTETAFHRFRPTAVLLLCLRGDSNAATTYAHSDDICAKLKPATLATLTRMWFTTSLDDSFRMNGEEDVKITCSILNETPRETYPSPRLFDICYDEALMTGTNGQAVDALGELREAIKSSIQTITLEAGDLLVLNNRTTIHGRLPFEPRYDGTDRWLQRMLVTDTMPPDNYIRMYEEHAEITSLGVRSLTGEIS
jgi:L-asparagine oxygenase